VRDAVRSRRSPAVRRYNSVYALDLDTLSRSEIAPATDGASPFVELYPGFLVWDPQRAALVDIGTATYTRGLGSTDDWVQLDSSLPPSGTSRRYFPAVYESKRHAVLLSDGISLFRLSSQSGSSWETLTTTAPPSDRFGATTVYDATGDRLLVYGGRASGDDPPLDDVWSLDLSGSLTWTQLAVKGTSPGGLVDPVAAYDSDAQRVLIYGGYRSMNAPSHELWALSLNAEPEWTRLSTAPPLPNIVSSSISATYEARGHRLLIASDSAVVFAVELGAAPAWHELCSFGTPPSRGLGVFASNALL
jgi:hypothetical protein